MNLKENNKDLDEQSKAVTNEEPKTAKREGCRCDKNCGCCETRGKNKEKTSGDKPKVIVASSLALLISTSAFAQESSAAKSFWADPFNHPMLKVYLAMGFAVVTIVLVVATLVYLLRVIKFLVRQNEIATARKTGITYVPSPTFFEKIWQDINDSVPVAKEEDIDLGHSYDGIRELDNHLPPWWKGLFYACVIWGIGYMIVYHITGSLPLSLDEYENELALADENARILKASKPAELIDENTLLYTADPDLIGKGKLVFTSNNCGSCHRADGGGNTIGPNLTDEYWFHGGSIKDIFATVNKGVLEKGMPAWGKVMSASDVRNVAFYIMSLQGSNPKDGKAPQGELHKPAKVKAPADSIVAKANL
jgi:cytochrome c oxidase cbb3-type subunit 3